MHVMRLLLYRLCLKPMDGELQVVGVGEVRGQVILAGGRVTPRVGVYTAGPPRNQVGVDE